MRLNITCVLEDVIQSLSNSEYRDYIVFIGGAALLKRLDSSFRRTTDIDISVEGMDVWDHLVNDLEYILNNNTKLDIVYRIIKRRGNKYHNTDSLRLTANNEIEFKIDMNVRKTLLKVELSDGTITYGLGELLSDKLSVVFSKQVFRRLKDIIDLVEIADNYDFRMVDFLSLELDKNKLDINYLHDVSEIQHVYKKFKGVKNPLLWEEFYAKALNFIDPIYYSIMEGYPKPLYWDKQKGGWFTC